MVAEHTYCPSLVLYDPKTCELDYDRGKEWNIAGDLKHVSPWTSIEKGTLRKSRRVLLQ